ncbi:MAG: hypothetical protein LBG64_00885 [Pseudomonadales bacterium]|jgi:hypothetical protein|nr:hypothetical protein [Pseudomonadales bacterium]
MLDLIWEIWDGVIEGMKNAAPILLILILLLTFSVIAMLESAGERRLEIEQLDHRITDIEENLSVYQADIFRTNCFREKGL